MNMAEDMILTIPLRESGKKAQKKRAKYSVSLMKKQVAMRVKSGNIKIGKFLNEVLWIRGKDKCQRRVRVKIMKDGETFKVELMGHDYKEFKAQPKKEAKGMKGALEERLSPKAMKNESLEKKIEGKEIAVPAGSPKAPQN